MGPREKGTPEVKASHGLAPVFDEANLVSAAGLAPVLHLAEKAGLSKTVADKVHVPAPNAPVKIRTLIAGMLAGADSIEDLDLLRAGGTAQLIGAVRAPSTMGTFLRSFTHGHVQQLHAVGRGLLTGLAEAVPSLVAGDDLVFVDMDDTIDEVYGYQKQGAGYGYSGVRGLNVLLTTISTPHSAPVIAECSLRRGATRSGASAGWQLRRALTTTRTIVGAGARVWVRADSAFAVAKTVKAAVDAGTWFSVTVPAWPTVTAAIATISEDAWTPIHYPHAVWEPETHEWISDAEVAEAPLVAFVSKPKGEQVTCRLVVRRVKRLGPAPQGQGELFTCWRHHAFITNTTLDAVAADAHHRDHAIIEQVNAELKAGPLAHLPSGKYAANAAWLACTVMAFNLSRAAAHATGMPKARMATMTRRIVATPARIAHTARHVIVHLPATWPWANAWTLLWESATSPPSPTPAT